MIQLKQFKFEKLQVWEIAMDYAEKIQVISAAFHQRRCIIPKARSTGPQTALL